MCTNEGQIYHSIRAVPDSEPGCDGAIRSQYEPYLGQSKYLKDKLFCRITGRYVAKTEAAVVRHSDGRRFNTGVGAPTPCAATSRVCPRCKESRSITRETASKTDVTFLAWRTPHEQLLQLLGLRHKFSALISLALHFRAFRAT